MRRLRWTMAAARGSNELMGNRTRSTFDATSARLRDLALATPEGEFLGSEDALVETLEVSRSTVRQSARLLEREGILQVRRGLNGGYFAGRASLRTVEAAVSGYLHNLDMNA